MIWNALSVRRATRRQNTHRAALNAAVEALEVRQFLSASIGAIVQPGVTILHPSATNIQGLTPSQTKTAYQFNGVTFNSGATMGDGTGQTIAIVDAFNDPTVASDLVAFDQQFGLPTANLTVVNQTGGTTLPTTDGEWSGEIALDVEWAHAIAPGANILLVESASDSQADLLTAELYARSVPAVSVVSMSWGGLEAGQFSDTSAELAFDTDFTTPGGHIPETFVAASGDEGDSLLNWPASSPNVLVVGGTALNVDASGNYMSETGWDGSTGGYSDTEPEPTYQSGVQSTGKRSDPDVAYDGDPNTGFAMYDTTPDGQGDPTGWEVVGGTSVGSPQWAALIAIADQGRVTNGSTTLDGITQTLPMLYGLYGTPGTSAYTTYQTYFNDVTTGGPQNIPQAVIGYDTVTGLGSPKAAAIISKLAAASNGGGGGGGTGGGGTGSGTGSGSHGGGSSGTGSGSTHTGSGSGTTRTGGNTNLGGTAADTPTNPATSVSFAFAGGLPSAAYTGSAGSLKVSLTNTGRTLVDGPISIVLSAVSDSDPSGAPLTLANITTPVMKLKAGQTKLVNLKFTYSSTLAPGSYHVVASTNQTFGTTAAAETTSTGMINILPGSLDLSTTFARSGFARGAAGNGTALVRVTNLGNIAAIGSLTTLLYGSADGVTIDGGAIGSLMDPTLNLKPGKSMLLKIRYAGANSFPFLIASTTSSLSLADSNPSDDVANATLS